LASDHADPVPPADAGLIRLRHEKLRRVAPAVQHEVNNALMVLASNLELLGRTAVEGAPRRQLDRSLEAMRRLDATIRGYLDVARREAEDRAAVPPPVAVAQVLPLLRVVLGSRHGFDLEPAEGIRPVLLDRARLDLALLSLARDTARGIKPGSRIVARAENRDAAGEVALLLTLPEDAVPEGETAGLLAAAASVTGGRLEAVDGGFALIWPRAAQGQLG
jgi:signal transduction histidine kinase